MTTVGIKVLKSQLSKYVAKATAGETVIVADRGRPVAMLSPVPRAVKVIDELRRQGVVQWSGKKLQPTTRRPWQPGDPDPQVSRQVLEDRR
ncbi:MAG: type II toxin-antitoxin system Phd/YefM family antitoxin [Planctomycetes bacterium]|nr:type II toxin-antitoxin system Phd/YefM family antitoxin [Planctomycetota bacterium]